MSWVSVIPSILVGSDVHFKASCVMIVQSEFFIDPILMTSVLLLLISRPDTREKFEKVLIISLTDSSVKCEKMCVSSAYCLILIFFILFWFHGFCYYGVYLWLETLHTK